MTDTMVSMVCSAFETMQLEESKSSRYKAIQQLKLLLFGHKGLSVDPCIFLYGHKGCGKEYVLSQVMHGRADVSNASSAVERHLIIVHCGKVEVSVQALLETILMEVYETLGCSENVNMKEIHCENGYDFIKHLRTLICNWRTQFGSNKFLNLVIGLRQAHILFSCKRACTLLLPILTDLQLHLFEGGHLLKEICTRGRCPRPWASVTTVFMSREDQRRCRHDSYSLSEIPCINLPSLSENELKVIMKGHLKQLISQEDSIDIEELLELIMVCVQPKWSGDVSEMLHLLETNWDEMRNVKGSVDRNYSYLISRIQLSLSSTCAVEPEFVLLDAPLLTKCLLVAAFLASYNDFSADRRFFAVEQSKANRRTNIVSKHKESKQLSLGPKPFTVQRVVTLMYAVVTNCCAAMSQNPSDPHYMPHLEELKNDLDGLSLYDQQRKILECFPHSTDIDSLFVSLENVGLVERVGGKGRLDLQRAKFKCLCGLDLVIDVAKSINFDLEAFLSDLH